MNFKQHTNNKQLNNQQRETHSLIENFLRFNHLPKQAYDNVIYSDGYTLKYTKGSIYLKNPVN